MAFKEAASEGFKENHKNFIGYWRGSLLSIGRDLATLFTAVKWKV